MYADFIGCAGDEIFNQIAKWQSMSAGILKMPIVLRVSVGSKYGAQHSQDWTALTAHIPGLKVVFPATPYDAKGLMTAALNGTDPVIFFESQRIYDRGEEFHEGGVPEGTYEIRIGEPDIKKPGKDITILTIGAVLYRALEAAKILEEQYGISAEVIDARSIVPFNYEKVIESVKKTGKIVLVGDACERGSVMRDMASNIAEMAFDYLDAPPGRRRLPQLDHTRTRAGKALLPAGGHDHRRDSRENHADRGLYPDAQFHHHRENAPLQRGRINKS